MTMHLLKTLVLKLFLSHIHVYWPLTTAPVRISWQCYYWHHVVSSQSVGAKAKCLMCKSSMSGSLSHEEISWQQTLYLNPRSWSADAGVAGITALVCMAVCTGVGKQLHTLPSHPTLDEPQGFSWWTFTLTHWELSASAMYHSRALLPAESINWQNDNQSKSSQKSLGSSSGSPLDGSPPTIWCLLLWTSSSRAAMWTEPRVCVTRSRRTGTNSIGAMPLRLVQMVGQQQKN